MSVERPPADASHAIEAARQAAASALAAVLPEPEAGLAAGILIGLRDRVDRDLAAAFTTAGVSHVVAISGWNIAIVAAAVAAMAGRLRRRRRSVLTMVAIVAYVAFAGASASVVRAGSDGRRRAAGARVRARRTSGRGARLGRGAPARRRPRARPRRGVPAVGAGDGRPDRVGDAADRAGSSASGRGHVPGWLAESLGVSLAAQAATLPIVLASFGRLAVLSPVVNLAVVPLVAPAMAAGLVAMLGGFARARGRAAVVGSVLAAPGWVSLRIMVAIVDAMAVAAVRERHAAGPASPPVTARGALAVDRASPTSGGEGASRGRPSPRNRRIADQVATDRATRRATRAASRGSRSLALVVAVVVDGRRRRQPARRRRAGDRARCRPGRRDPRRGLARRAPAHRWRARSRPAARRARRADPAVGSADRRGRS